MSRISIEQFRAHIEIQVFRSQLKCNCNFQLENVFHAFLKKLSLC